MKEKIVYKKGGLGVSWILFFIFLILKLTGAITWSWIWVFAPLWIPIGILIIFGAILTLLLVLMEVINKWKYF